MKTLLLFLLLLAPLPDKITGSLSVLAGNDSLPGVHVRLGLSAQSEFGTITTEIFDCENGQVRVGAPPTSGDLAVPYTVALSGDFPPGIVCIYRFPGTYHPNVQIFDNLGASDFVSTTVTVRQ